MAITTGASGVEVTTAAKNGTLPSQSGMGAAQVKFDTAITTNNGNLMAAPTFAGRLAVIRWGLVDEETRYITGVSGDNLTCTVHEAWTVPPVMGDTYHISYIVQDAATVTGFGLINKRTTDYSLSRVFRVGLGTQAAFFALLDGASLESHTTAPPFQVRNLGRWQNGYLAGGQPVSGGYIIHTNPAGTVGMQLDSGSETRFYDLFATSVYNVLWTENGGAHTWSKVKLYSCGRPAQLRGPELRSNLTIEGKGTAQDQIDVDTGLNVDGLTAINTYGLKTSYAACTVQRYRSVRNTRDVEVSVAGQIWTFKNPVWGTVVSPVIQWTNGTGDVEERFDLAFTVADVTGAALSGARVYVEDAATGLVVTGTTAGDGLVTAALLQRLWRNAGAVSQKGPFTLRVLRYGQHPFEQGLAPTAAVTQTVTLADDAGITLSEAQADAVTGITVNHYPSPLVNADGTWTWVIDCGGNALSDVYAYLAAQAAKTAPNGWGGVMLRTRTRLLLREGDNYRTERIAGEGVYLFNRGAGTVTAMTDDYGAVYTPPVTAAHTLTGLQTGSEVRYYRTSDGVELYGVETSGTSTAYNYQWSGDIPVYIHIHHAQYQWGRIETTLTNTSATIPVSQRYDRVYVNP